MIEFPFVPHWWRYGSKFTKLEDNYTKPDYIIGFDTETCNGEIITMQFSSSRGDVIKECNVSNSLDVFFNYLETFNGNIIVYCFNASFDLPQVFRKFLDLFQQDDFEIQTRGWQCKVFCSRNWHSIFKSTKNHVFFLDIHCYFSGNLKSVSASFGLEVGKLDRPEGLGYKKFNIKKDHVFVEYALMDARLCYLMGLKIDEMHEHYDIPQSTSSANFAEKVFRRNFIHVGERIQYTPTSAMRLAELTYHGGKNGYYLDTPCHAKNCYEYDFNSAYPYAMYSLPSFLGGNFVKSTKLSDKYIGVYKYKGVIKPCPYGSLFDLEFHYFKNVKRPVEGYATSFEIIEAVRSNELELERVSGYIWQPESEESPLKRYVQFFWEQKNKLKKGTVQYLFAKLCLNSLYGKFVQRNPSKQTTAKLRDDGSLDVEPQREVAGGLYHPFIGSLITGHTRSRLHKEEHLLNAIECSTDSVKSQVFHKPYAKAHYLGAMQMEKLFCKTCDIATNKFDAIFARNRLNVLMCKKGHVLKAALHGFWREPEELKRMAFEKRNIYEVNRMPMVREAMLHSNKPMFQMYSEDRTLNVDWESMVEL